MYIAGYRMGNLRDIFSSHCANKKFMALKTTKKLHYCHYSSVVWTPRIVTSNRKINGAWNLHGIPHFLNDDFGWQLLRVQFFGCWSLGPFGIPMGSIYKIFGTLARDCVRQSPTGTPHKTQETHTTRTNDGIKTKAGNQL